MSAGTELAPAREPKDDEDRRRHEEVDVTPSPAPASSAPELADVNRTPIAGFTAPTT
jgi:hypothetical protein